MSDVVIWLANRRLNGLLIVEQETIRKEFVVVQGTITYATTNDPREYFSQFLINLGLLTENQLERAYTTQLESSVLLGRILVMIGTVPEEQIIQTLRVKISESMLDTFRWNRGHFDFRDPCIQEQRPHVSVAIPLIDLHREGVARKDMWETFSRLFPHPDQPLKVCENDSLRISGLEQLEKKLIDLAKSGLGMKSITQELHATDYHIASRLIDLHQRGFMHSADHSATLSELEMSPESLQTITDSSLVLKYPPCEFGSYSCVEFQQQRDPSTLTAEEEDCLRSKVPIKLREATPDELSALSARERYILGRIDAKRSVNSILQLIPMHDLEVLDILRRLEKDKLIQL
ncbi:MAG: DUF4388 domain-containing protein [Myxococcales bacterium]|nr:DUF4388 domain-containing protein [Myxococcales bacterium]